MRTLLYDGTEVTTAAAARRCVCRVWRGEAEPITLPFPFSAEELVAEAHRDVVRLLLGGQERLRA